MVQLDRILWPSANVTATLSESADVDGIVFTGGCALNVRASEIVWKRYSMLEKFIQFKY